MAGQQIEGLLIDPKWLEEGKDLATCGVCKMVLEQPTTGCPEGHAFCRQCYVAELALSKQCPTCGHATKVKPLNLSPQEPVSCSWSTTGDRSLKPSPVSPKP